MKYGNLIASLAITITNWYVLTTWAGYNNSSVNSDLEWHLSSLVHLWHNSIELHTYSLFAYASNSIWILAEITVSLFAWHCSVFFFFFFCCSALKIHLQSQRVSVDAYIQIHFGGLCRAAFSHVHLVPLSHVTLSACLNMSQRGNRTSLSLLLRPLSSATVRFTERQRRAGRES